MAPKARINEEHFRQAVLNFNLEEINLLNSAKSNAEIWGRLCSLMTKPDNIENRRACYDLWKHKISKSQNICDSMMQVQQNERNDDFSSSDNLSIKLKFDQANQTEDNIEETAFSQSKLIEKKDENFIEKLRDFLLSQKKAFTVIATHDPTSECCSGDIESIYIVCKCMKSTSNLLESETVFPKIFVANDDSNDDTQIDRIDNTTNKPSPSKCTSSICTSSTSTPPTCTPPNLRMSPISTPSPIFCPSSMSTVVISTETGGIAVASHTHQHRQMEDNSMSPANDSIHSVLNAEQKKILTVLQRQTVDSSVFTINVSEIQEIERKSNVIISPDDMNRLKQFQLDQTKKKLKIDDKAKLVDLSHNKNTQKRNLEWTIILDKYLKYSNDYCVFAYDRHHFTSRTSSDNDNDFFMSAIAHCKFNTCSCTFKAYINNVGALKIDYSGKIIHELGKIHARPIRGTRRDDLKKITSLGTTPGALHLQQLQIMSDDNKKAGNRNSSGSSPSVIRKISSDANIDLRRNDDIDKSLRKLKDEQAKNIFPAEQVPGYLQEISIDPLRLVFFTAGGLKTYYEFVSTMPLSWDATGGIVINHGKRIFYYELTMSNLKKGGPSFPITVMLSNSHGTMDIIHWINCFIQSYKQTFGYGKVFPKPPVLHSDRASVFLLAGIQLFNRDETMAQYVERCWRIVKGTANQDDLKITIIHACLGHFMKSVKRNASKDLDKKQVPFGMWLIALLVNSNTLDEMNIIWRNICIILLSTNQNNQYKMSLSILSKLADEMNSDPEKTNIILKNVAVTSKGQFKSTLELDTADDDVDDDADYAAIGEEKAITEMPSSFKHLFTNIFRECKESLAVYDAPEWEKLPSNPLFSAAYLSHILKLYMPTVPIWSNLLLGNFSRRYGYKTDAIIPPCPCHCGRTTGVSESKMRVLKEAILHKKVYSRIDEVVSKMGQTIEAVEIQFADYALNKQPNKRLLPLKLQNSARESWAKHKKAEATTGMYTSKAPQNNLVLMVNRQLLGHKDESRLDLNQLPNLFQFENKNSNCWLNSTLQMILASGDIIKTISQFGEILEDYTSPDIMITGNFLKFLITRNRSSNIDKKRLVIQQKLLTDHIQQLYSIGVPISLGNYNCLVEFFDNLIFPTFEFYNIDYRFVVETSITCCSCHQVMTIKRDIWNTLLVDVSSNLGDLNVGLEGTFKQLSQSNVCPNCLNNDNHPSKLSMVRCPKHLFIRFEPRDLMGRVLYNKLSSHINLKKFISNEIVFARSYSRFYLQSFINFTTDYNGHFITYAKQKGEWYRFDDMNITLAKETNLFGQQIEPYPVLFAHYTRPTDTDVFSKAMWNILTNFSKCNLALLPTLSFNDAMVYFATHHIVPDNPLNLVAIRLFRCDTCKKDTYIVDSMREIWNMEDDLGNINRSMNNFLLNEAKCSSCKQPGLTNVTVYNVPQYLILKMKSNNPDCMSSFDEVRSIYIRPCISFPSIQYNIETVLTVLEEDNIAYIRKNQDGLTMYNDLLNSFELLEDLSPLQTALASEWTLFIYRTNTDYMNYAVFDEIYFDPTRLIENKISKELTRQSIEKYLHSSNEVFKVGNITISTRDIQTLLQNNTDLDDNIINAHLTITASTTTDLTRVLVVDSILVTNLLNKNLKHIEADWLGYDLILCPIHQQCHWYLIIIDRQQKLIIEFDSLPMLPLPRDANLNRLLHFLEKQNYLKTSAHIDFLNSWKIMKPTKHPNLHQTDTHSCGIHLLIQAQTYTSKRTFTTIPTNEYNYHRLSIAHNIIMNAASTEKLSPEYPFNA